MFLDHFLSAKNRPQTRKYLTLGFSFSDLFLSLKKWKHKFRTLYTTLREGPCFVFFYVFFRFSVCLSDRFFWALWEHFWPILVAPETLQIDTWPSKVMLSSRRNARFEKIYFFHSKTRFWKIIKKWSGKVSKIRPKSRKKYTTPAAEKRSRKRIRAVVAPWPTFGSFWGHFFIVFGTVLYMIISFSLSTTGHKFEMFETENRTQADWYEPNPAEKLSAKPMSH